MSTKQKRQKSKPARVPLGMNRTIRNKYDELYYRYSVEQTHELREALLTLRIVSAGLSAKADTYDGKGPDLMFSVCRILEICEPIEPSINTIASDFRKCWLQYISAEAATLGDAFGICRPKNWDHQAKKFQIQQCQQIEKDVDELVADGMNVVPACTEVGKKYDRSGGTIKRIYYEVRKALLS